VGTFRSGSGDSRGKAVPKGADLQGMSATSNQYRPLHLAPYLRGFLRSGACWPMEPKGRFPHTSHMSLQYGRGHRSEWVLGQRPVGRAVTGRSRRLQVRDGATPRSRTAGETSRASASRTSVVRRGSRSPRSIRETSVTWMPERWLTSSWVRFCRFRARETFCAKTSRGGGTLVMVL
jgi:hypothetical protein